MRKSFIIAILLLFIHSIIYADSEVRSQDSLSILFIGNSYFWMNDMPGMFRDIAHKDGKEILVEDYLVSGTNIADHVMDENCHEKINSMDWDYIVLIGSSSLLGYPEFFTRDHTFLALQDIRSIIYNNCDSTNILFCMPWAYEAGVSLPDGSTDNYEAMQLKIYSNTINYCDSLGLMIAPIGWAWQRVLQQQDYPLHYLHDIDFHHPNTSGTYLGACVIFSSIFRESTIGNVFNPGLTFNDKRYFQETGSTVVLNTLTLWNLPGLSTGIYYPDQNLLNTKVYPNPADGIFNLEMENDFLGVIKTTMYTMDGKHVYEDISLKYGKSMILRIESRQLPKGQYILVLEHGNIKESKKIVIL